MPVCAERLKISQVRFVCITVLATMAKAFDSLYSLVLYINLKFLVSSAIAVPEPSRAEELLSPLTTLHSLSNVTSTEYEDSAASQQSFVIQTTCAALEVGRGGFAHLFRRDTGCSITAGSSTAFCKMNAICCTAQSTPSQQWCCQATAGCGLITATACTFKV